MNNKEYFLEASGAMQTGWLKEEDNWHYLNSKGAKHLTTTERKKVIYIDPGHGAHDSGAKFEGVSEKSLNLDISNYLVKELEEMDYLVMMTRTNDTFIPLIDRSKDGNLGKADIFVSIHHNSLGGRGTARGIETFIQNSSGYVANRKNFQVNDPRIRKSVELADFVQNDLIKGTGLRSRGVRGSNLSVLRNTQMPAILVELGFMDHSKELSIIKEADYQKKAAKSIAKGIEKYFNNNR